jgi:general nucleoside transport system ATP-binding protein
MDHPEVTRQEAPETQPGVPTRGTPTGPPAIEAVDIVKRFGPLVANNRVSLQAFPGEILALVGENGAGKSTLMNVLSGLLQPDEGEIRLKGQAVRFRSPRDAIEHGIGMVHQHFMLIPKLTVAENVVLGHEPSGVLFDQRAARRKVAELSEAYGLKLDPAERVEALSVGLQQRVEILKILYWGSDILIFDEPTAVLTPQETRELFVVLRELAIRGRAIIFITHKLKEVMAISNRITVMRAGQVVGQLTTAQTSPAEIASKMIGREVLPEVHKAPAKVGDPVLEVRDLEVLSDRGVPAVRGLSLEIRGGEIVGIAGVEGNGQTELVEALTGLREAQGGTATVNGIELLAQFEKNGSASRSQSHESGRSHRLRGFGESFRRLTKPAPAYVREAGVSYVPEDRRERGLVLSYSVADNTILGLQSTPQFSQAGILNFGRIQRWARTLVTRFDVRPPKTNVPVGTLSGGNQQKVVLAREFSENPSLLIAAQPTRGLDVGAAQFVHERLVEKRDQGTAILLVSAELDEVMELADRIAVIYEGQIMDVFEAGTANEDEIGLLMTGGAQHTEEQSIDLEAPALSQGS